jgi:hypothetical protein
MNIEMGQIWIPKEGRIGDKIKESIRIKSIVFRRYVKFTMDKHNHEKVMAMTDKFLLENYDLL